jgi:hypothetical protein
MPHFDTDIRHADSARRANTRRGASNARAADALAYHRRLAALRVPAPDTLRARVQRDLRRAPATSRAE